MNKKYIYYTFWNNDSDIYVQCIARNNNINNERFSFYAFYATFRATNICLI